MRYSAGGEGDLHTFAYDLHRCLRGNSSPPGKSTWLSFLALHQSCLGDEEDDDEDAVLTFTKSCRDW